MRSLCRCQHYIQVLQNQQAANSSAVILLFVVTLQFHSDKVKQYCQSVAPSKSWWKCTFHHKCEVLELSKPVAVRFKVGPGFITGLTYRDKLPFTLTFTPMGKSEQAVNLTCMSFDYERKPEYPGRTHTSACKLLELTLAMSQQH